MTNRTKVNDNALNNEINVSHLSQHQFCDFSTFRPRDFDDTSPAHRYGLAELETTKREKKNLPQSPRSREQARQTKRLKRKTKLSAAEKENIPHQLPHFAQGEQSKSMKGAAGRNYKLENDISADRDSSFGRNSTIYSISSQNKFLNHDNHEGPGTWSSIREEFTRGHYNDFLNSHSGNDSTLNRDTSIGLNHQKRNNNRTRTLSDIVNTDKTNIEFNVPLEEQEEVPHPYVQRTTTVGQTEMFLMPTVPNFEVEVVPASSRQVTQTQDQSDNPQLSEYAVKAYIRRKITSFVATIAISTLAVLMTHSFVYSQLIFDASYLYLFYIIVERTISNSIRREGEPWLRNENLLAAWTAACSLISLVILNLKISQAISAVFFASIPLILATASYFFKSQAPPNLRKRQGLLRLACTLQVLLIGLKLDGVMNFDWRFVFVGCWMYAGIVGLHFIGNALFALFLILVLALRKRHIRICAEELLGLLWNCIYYGKILSDFGVLFGFVQAYGTDNGTEFLELAAYVNLGFSVLGVIYGIVNFKDVIKFLQPRLSKSYLNELQVLSPSEISEPVLSLQLEKKDCYFVKMSTTYFIPLDSSLSLKNIEKIKRIRDLFKSFRTPKGQNSQERQNTQPNNNDAKLVAVDMLERFKERIKQKSEKEEQGKPKKDLRSARHADFKKINLEVEEDKEASKLYLSADNIDKIIEANTEKEIAEAQEIKKAEEEVCYLCFDGKFNAVLMDCGHGGVCYECAIAILKSKNECMECRAEIKAVYKIDPNPKVLDIVKGFEVSKATFKSPAPIAMEE